MRKNIPPQIQIWPCPSTLTHFHWEWQTPQAERDPEGLGLVAGASPRRERDLGNVAEAATVLRETGNPDLYLNSHKF